MKKNYSLLYTSVMVLCLGFISFAALGQEAGGAEWGSGTLRRNTKIGVWEYYAFTSTGSRIVVQRYDHTANKLLYFRPGNDSGCMVETAGNEWKRVHVDQPPLYLGGIGLLGSYLSRVVYPAQAESDRVQGQVVVRLVIDTLGHASKMRVLRGIGHGCDEEALRVAELVPDQWIPARIGTRAVTAEFELPFTFRMAN